MQARLNVWTRAQARVVQARKAAPPPAACGLVQGCGRCRQVLGLPDRWHTAEPCANLPKTPAFCTVGGAQSRVGRRSRTWIPGKASATMPGACRRFIECFKAPCGSGGGSGNRPAQGASPGLHSHQKSCSARLLRLAGGPAAAPSSLLARSPTPPQVGRLCGCYRSLEMCRKQPGASAAPLPQTAPGCFRRRRCCCHASRATLCLPVHLPPAYRARVMAAPSSDWIFGFGSLIHNPGFEYSETLQPCYIRGYRCAAAVLVLPSAAGAAQQKAVPMVSHCSASDGQPSPSSSFLPPLQAGVPPRQYGPPRRALCPGPHGHP